MLGDDSMPAWSPDGARIAFTSNRDQQAEINVVAADGRGQRRLTRRPRSEDTFPRFSPDGQSIAFSSAGPRGERVMLMAADGSDVRTVIAGSAPALRP